jgi:predicted nucleic acid-binding protein
MAMTSGKAFLDTNILLRSTITQYPLYAQAKQLVDTQLDADVELWISRQVIREYIAQVTRPQTFMNPMTMDELDTKLRTIRVLFKIADDTEAVTTALLALMRDHPTGGKQVHDANVVATMLTYGIDTLLTTNVKDMKRFEDKITILSLEDVK